MPYALSEILYEFFTTKPQLLLYDWMSKLLFFTQLF